MTTWSTMAKTISAEAENYASHYISMQTVISIYFNTSLNYEDIHCMYAFILNILLNFPYDQTFKVNESSANQQNNNNIII